MIDVWSSPWLRDDDDLFVQTPRDEELRGLRVCDLFIPELREWDVELIQSLFSERDASAILSIPIPSNMTPDCRIWHFSRKGEYTVRSGYRLIMERIAPREHLAVAGPWRRLWDINAPPRLRCFAWRVARGVLPTRMALQARHIHVPSECGVCTQEMENSWHLFLRCSFAKRCWEHAGLLGMVEECMENSESMREWIFKIISKDDADCVARVVAVMGAIWHERNNRVWSDKTAEHVAVVREGLEGLQNWTVVRESGAGAGVGNSVCGKWHPPPPGVVKCNVDAALFGDEGRRGLGAVIRDETGQVLHYRMASFDGCPTATECEALALEDAVRWVETLAYPNVVFELDSLNVVSAVEADADDSTELGMIVNSVRRLFRPPWRIQFVRRSGNTVAHAIARRSRYLVSPLVGDTSPSWLIDALSDLCLVC
ncbi:Putative ribonuclease H protein At1g65750 [Linum perenne]